MGGSRVHLIFILMLLLVGLWQFWWSSYFNLSPATKIILHKLALYPQVSLFWFMGPLAGLILNQGIRLIQAYLVLSKAKANKIKPLGKSIEARIGVSVSREFFFSEIVSLYENEVDFYDSNKNQAHLGFHYKTHFIRQVGVLILLLTIMLVIVSMNTFRPETQKVEVTDRFSLGKKKVFYDASLEDLSKIRLKSDQLNKRYSIGRPYFIDGKIIHFSIEKKSPSLNALIRIIDTESQVEVNTRLKKNETTQLGKLELRIKEIQLNKVSLVLTQPPDWNQTIHLLKDKIHRVSGSRYVFLLEETYPDHLLWITSSSSFVWSFLILGLLTSLILFLVSSGPGFHVIISWQNDSVTLYGFLSTVAFSRNEFEKVVLEITETLEVFTSPDQELPIYLKEVEIEVR